MESINSVDGSRFSERSRRKKAKKNKGLKSRHFAAVIDEAGRDEASFFDMEAEDHHRHNLEQLLDEVYESGEQLVENQSLENVKRYRRTVREFLDYVVEKMLTLEQKTSGVNVQRRKRFTQVKVIDARLERLVAAVLQNQGKQLDLLERIEEINGLIVDLIT
jgi:uncharacterized protein YaaR (DUF327 family)